MNHENMGMLDLAVWFDHVSAMSPLAFGLVALAGLAMGVAPSSLPLFSVVAGYVAGQAVEQAKRQTKGLWLSAGFMLGMASVDAAIGACSASSDMPSSVPWPATSSSPTCSLRCCSRSSGWRFCARSPSSCLS